MAFFNKPNRSEGDTELIKEFYYKINGNNPLQRKEL